MATAPALDFDALLAPISEEFPTGQSRRVSPAVAASIAAVNDLQRKATEDERKIRDNALAAEPDQSASMPNWGAVLDKAEQHLTEQSKDLWVATSLINALMREQGYAGLRDGVRLVRELVERYWDGIHPRPEDADDDDEDKGLAFTVLRLRHLGSPGFQWEVRNLPITADGHSLNTLIDAEALEKITDLSKKEERISRGAVSLEMFTQSLRETNIKFFKDLVEDIEQTQAEIQTLDTLLKEKCGNDANGYPISPTFSALVTTLEETLTRIRSLVGDRLEAAAASAEASVAEEGGGEGGAKKAGNGLDGAGNVNSREKALDLLLQVAQYFRRSEPHSPVSYALEQAVRWGKMPLPQLLLELIGDEAVRSDLSKRTGVPLTPEQST